MKHLILMRHAKAGEADSDHSRPLHPEGHREASLMGPALVALGPSFHPGRVLCSTARRARETWADVQPSFSVAPPADLRDELYLASSGSLLSLVQALDGEIETALVIGHEPGLSRLVSLLAGRASHQVEQRAQRGMSPAAIAALRFDTEDWMDLEPGAGELIEFQSPRDLATR